MRYGFFRLGASEIAIGAALLSCSCRQPVEQAFAYSTDAPSRAGLVRTLQGVAVANDYGTVALLDESGRALWRVSACREVVARPVVAGDVLVVACTGGDWVGLSLADGKERWHSAIKASVSTPLVADPQRAYGVDPEGGVWAVDAATGAIAWRHSTSELRATKEHRTFAPPAVWKDLLLTPLAEAGLQAFDAAQGTWRWKLPTRGLTGLLPVQDRLMVLWPSGRLAALKPDASYAWTRELGAPALSGPALVSGMLWVGLEGNVLVGVSQDDGTEVARFALPAPALGRATGLDGLIVVPTSGTEGRLLAFRLGRTRPVFSARVDSPLRTDAVALGGSVAVVSTDGRVLAFTPSEAPR